MTGFLGKHFSIILVILIGLSMHACGASVQIPDSTTKENIILLKTGADQTELYFERLKDSKGIALVANQTSVIAGVHLVDTLISAGIPLVKVLAPEHGFRGEAEAGAHISSATDPKTGLPIVSLYGSKKKPAPADLQGIDLVVFDIQDVGARFYTYISTLAYLMEACAEQNIPLLVLDRPNPHGYYVDGPILDPAFSSFVGMHQIPIVHGMTIAEYACMLNGEGWLKNGVQCKLDWVKMEGYTHKTRYQLPIYPSPNLPDMESVYLYPSLCLFEGTIVSVGRGTDLPFRIIGHPVYTGGDFVFTPRQIPGVSENPPFKGIECKGLNLSAYAGDIKDKGGIRLEWLIEMHRFLGKDPKFFSNFFDKLAGSSELRNQIKAGISEAKIIESWQPGLNKFKLMRKKYLLYEDFE